MDPTCHHAQVRTPKAGPMPEHDMPTRCHILFLLLAPLCGCEGIWKPYLDGQAAEDCASEADDDKDGLINFDDPDCWPKATPPAVPAEPPAALPTVQVVPPVELCANAADEDGDSLIDCADPDCAADPSCQSPAGPAAP